MTVDLTLGEGRREAIAEMLKRAASRVEERGPEAWEISLGNGSRLRAAARVEGAWLQLEAPLKTRRRAPEPWDLLRSNALLEGGVRFVLTGGPGSCLLRADLPLSPRPDLESGLRACCRGLREGASIWKRGSVRWSATEAPRRDEPRPVEPEGGEAPDLEALCEESGWSSREREAGGRWVELDAERGSYRAALSPREGGGVLATAELARLLPPDPSGRLAVAVLLLTVGGAVRLARPTLCESEAEAVALAEVALPPPLRADAIDRALGALSTLGWLCGPEIAALGEPALNDAYLEARGWSPPLR
jgi:hypothetical protein